MSTRIHFCFHDDAKALAEILFHLKMPQIKTSGEGAAGADNNRQMNLLLDRYIFLKCVLLVTLMAIFGLQRI